jgi:ketosteroid isomerase-like protein
MLDSAQVAVVRRLYEARGNPEVIRQVLAPDVRWEVVEGFPYSGVYVGVDDVLHNFFGRLFQDFEASSQRALSSLSLAITSSRWEATRGV